MAVRTHLRAHIDWLRGLPIGAAEIGGLQWRTVPWSGAKATPEVMLVDRERLRRTSFELNAMFRRFPRALPRVVGDVQPWFDRITLQLDLLKASVHDRAALPMAQDCAAQLDLALSTRLRVKALIDAEPTLEPVVRSLIWLNWHDESALRDALAACEPAMILPVLERVATVDRVLTAVALVDLAQHGAGAALATLLADPRVWTATSPSPSLDRTLRGRLNGSTSLIAQGEMPVTDCPGWPPAPLGPDLAALARTLMTKPVKVRNRQIEVLERFLPEARLEQWQRWRMDVSDFEREARRVYGRLKHEREPTETEARLKALAVRAMAHLNPPRFDWPELRQTLDVAAAAPDTAVAVLIDCVAASAPTADRLGPAQDLIETWMAAFRRWPRKAGLFRRLLQALRHYLERAAPSAAEVARIEPDQLSELMIGVWLERAEPERLIQPMMVAVEAWLTSGVEWPDGGSLARHVAQAWEALYGVLKATGDAKLAARAVAAVPPWFDALHGELWLALFELAGRDSVQLKRLAAGCEPGLWQSEHVHELRHWIETPVVASILADALAGGEGRRVLRMMSQARLLRMLGSGLAFPEPPVPTSIGCHTEGTSPESETLTQYPEPLRPLVSELRRWKLDADRAIDSVLGADLPSAERLRGEIAALRQLLVSTDGPRRTSIGRRLANLERRLVLPHPISPQRCANLARKLAHHLLTARIIWLETALDEVRRNRLESAIGVAPPAAWLAQPEVETVLLGFNGLTPAFRALGFRMLRLSIGRAPRDLRFEPANAGFLKRLRRLGVTPTPWLDGIGPRDVHATCGRLVIDLETNPLQVMRMGAPFETCLSPGAFNFFSAIANAADINKRVLYAHDETRTIRARMLIALNDAGEIVTFHIYMHEHDDRIVDGFRAYVRDLADMMSTRIAPTGRIRTLLAPDWYDDGPRDLTGQLAFLRRGSDFLKELATLEAGTLIGRMEAELAGGPITPSVVCMLAGSDELDARPDLIRPLAPFLGELGRIDPYGLVTLVPLFRRAGDADMALRLIQHMLRVAPNGDYRSDAQFTAITEYLELGKPFLALSLLKRTRPRGVRDWSDEMHHRALLAARAFRDAGRPHRALHLARIALSNGVRHTEALVAELERAIAM